MGQGVGRKIVHPNYVSNVIRENEIDICCLQETEIESSFPTGILSFKGYSLETEMNDTKI